MNDKEIPKAVLEYQCPGCVNGGDCFVPEQSGIGCGKHFRGRPLRLLAEFF